MFEWFPISLIFAFQAMSSIPRSERGLNHLRTGFSLALGMGLLLGTMIATPNKSSALMTQFGLGLFALFIINFRASWLIQKTFGTSVKQLQTSQQRFIDYLRLHLRKIAPHFKIDVDPRGTFGPAVLIGKTVVFSEKTIHRLHEAELKAVLFHEVAHDHLKHLLKRPLLLFQSFSWTVVIWMIPMSVLIVFCSDTPQFQTLIFFGSLLGSILIQTAIYSRLIKNQELEADQWAIEQGAHPLALLRALKMLTPKNQHFDRPILCLWDTHPSYHERFESIVFSLSDRQELPIQWLSVLDDMENEDGNSYENQRMDSLWSRLNTLYGLTDSRSRNSGFKAA